MVAGIWFQRMSASDLLRAISPPDVLVLLLLPGAFAFVPMLVAILLAIPVFQHRLTLAEAVDPAVGVLLVLEIARHILAKLTADRARRLYRCDLYRPWECMFANALRPFACRYHQNWNLTRFEYGQ